MMLLCILIKESILLLDRVFPETSMILPVFYRYGNCVKLTFGKGALISATLRKLHRIQKMGSEDVLVSYSYNHVHL